MERLNLERLLIEHTDAWNSHDLDRLIGLFAEDCAFEASAGPEACGHRFDGWAEVRTAFAEVFDSMPDANWGGGRHFVISDDYGLSEWRLTGTLADGSRGCLRLRRPHGSQRQDRSQEFLPKAATSGSGVGNRPLPPGKAHDANPSERRHASARPRRAVRGRFVGCRRPRS